VVLVDMLGGWATLILMCVLMWEHPLLALMRSMLIGNPPRWPVVLWVGPESNGSVGSGRTREPSRRPRGRRPGRPWRPPLQW